MRSLLALILTLAIFRPAFAGNCHQFFRVHHRTYVAPVVVAPIGYGVGSDIALDSVVRRAIREELGKLNLTQPQAQPLAKVDTSILVARCSRCHGNTATPAGALVIDGTTPFPPEALQAWMKMAARGQDVPEQMKPVMAGLKPDDIAAITDALLGQ